jgi:hypothetical protein
MKIEFEIEKKETVLLLDIIKSFMGQTSNAKILKSLSKIITEIESDLRIGDEIFKNLRDRLAPYTNGNRILLESNLKIYLGISNNFITRSGGLEREANFILKKVILEFKPNYDLNKIEKIQLSAIKKCKKISDVVTIIQEKYEKL